jgi:rhodanese-related sulfurtransferase
MGYTNVSYLEGGINRWATLDYTTEWGSNVISKEFGEKVEVVYHVPEINAIELHERMVKGDKLVILDSRTPEEYRRFAIPGGRSVPGGELALRITDIAKDLDEDTTVIVNCAGRTRSVIGTRVLQRMGLTNVYGLKNGTAGWALAGYELEVGADRTELPEVSAEGLAAAEAYAARLAGEDGVRYLDIPRFQEMAGKADRETMYMIDVRSREEYADGHIPGFRWFPGGQVVQRSDEVLVVRNSPIIFACDGRVRATQTASWYRQFGFQDVFVVDGGTTAWVDRGHVLEKGVSEREPFGLAQARARVRMVSPLELQADTPPVVLFVDSSQDFSRGHVPGARWEPRGWLEFEIGDFAAARDTPIAVTCADGRNAPLAAVTLLEMGYQKVSALEGGMGAWRRHGLAVEQGLSGVMRPPTDLVLSGPDRNYADAINYLRWETALGDKYGTH